MITKYNLFFSLYNVMKLPILKENHSLKFHQYSIQLVLAETWSILLFLKWKEERKNTILLFLFDNDMCPF